MSNRHRRFILAKLTGPLFSLSASGSIGKTLVFGGWKGVQYARQHVIPNNPRTTIQENARSLFKNLNAIFALMGNDAVQSWTNSAAGLPLTDRNLFLKVAMPLTDAAGDWSATPLLRPFQGLGLLETIPCVGGNDLITLTPTFPTIPAGWTVAAVIAVALLNEPAIGNDYAWKPADVVTKRSATGSGVAISITGLGSAASYNVSVILELQGPTYAVDGILRYSNVMISPEILTT